MLKPWVVVALLWAYRGGLALTLALAVTLGCARGEPPLGGRLRWPLLFGAMIAVFLGTAWAGLLLEYDGRTLLAFLYCAGTFALGRASRAAAVSMALLGVAGWVA